ncbi:MAG: hypothetical protein DYG92_09520 [Leptolyngbya sp. PLA1]|nr:hypothetical protein [Leptolyngbya sp. PLA1]
MPLLLGAAAILLAIGPASAVLTGLVVRRQEIRPGAWSPSIPLLATTIAWAVGIGTIAAVIALPSAWVMRGRPWERAVFWLVPLAMPSYLCYTAYGLARAPGTWLGDLVERAAQEGWTGLPVLVGRMLAVGGLALWAWPLAAMVMAVGFGRLDSGLLDALRLEPWGPARRAWVIGRLCWRWVAGGVAIVALVMFGSAVPLHLANAPTYAVRAWFELTLSPGGPSVWVSAWPVLAVAGVAGWWLTRTTSDAGAGQREAAPVRGVSLWLARAVWACSTVVPLCLCAWSLRDWGSLVTFWRVSGGAVGQSAGVALLVGLVTLFLGMAVWAAATSGGGASRGAARALCGVLVGFSLIPGVLVGRAIVECVQLVPGLGAIAEGPGMLVWAHAARFSWLGAVTGMLLAAREARALADLRRLDGSGLVSWLVVCLPRGWGAVACAAAGAAALSVHEIEASIIVQPPGSVSLAQTLLGDLHFARSEELAAGVLQVLVLTWGMAAAASWLGGRVRTGIRA